MRRALVTGGGGFLGSAIVRRLVADGWVVRTVARNDYPAIRALGVDHHRADLSQAGTARRILEGIDVVFHVAARTGIWGPRRAFVAANVDATRDLLTAMRDAHTPRLVYTSSPSVVFDRQDHVEANASLPYPTRHLAYYPATKAQAEREVLAAASPTLATVALRPHLIWGPGDPWLLPRLFARARQGRLRIVGDGANRVSLTYIDNAAIAHVQAAHGLEPGVPWSGRAFFVNDPVPVQLWPWLNDLFTELGLPRVEGRVSQETAWAAGALAELVWTLFRLRGDPPITRFVAAQLGTSHTYRITPAQQAFGYRPVVGAEEALQRTVAWWATKLESDRS